MKIMKRTNKEKFHSDRGAIFASLAKSARFSKDNLEENTGSFTSWLIGIVLVGVAAKAGWFSYIFDRILLFIDWFIFGLRDACNIPLAQLTLSDIFGVISGLFIRFLIGFIVFAIFSGILQLFKKRKRAR